MSPTWFYTRHLIDFYPKNLNELLKKISFLNFLHGVCRVLDFNRIVIFKVYKTFRIIYSILLSTTVTQTNHERNERESKFLIQTE